MNERYLSDQEYKDYFVDLGGIRRNIVRELPLKPDMKVLDLATGYGYFAFEIGRSVKDIRVTGIDISKTDVTRACKGLAKEYRFKDRMNFLQMDATKLGFTNESFDFVVNFLGFEDIYMTRGMTGVTKAFTETWRVLKPEKLFSLTVMPPDEMETAAQRLDAELFSYICNAKWLEYKEYIKLLCNSGFSLVSKKNHYTRKKLKSDQAIEEIKFACDNVPEIYGTKTRTFEETWGRYGRLIKKKGLGRYSKVVTITAIKQAEHKSNNHLGVGLI